ncbi:MAG: hypothetical protein JXB46_00095 [Candidatus Eisenbacteria bacterium]|nr:hypothetical protein [Candidatus Eisenbacteria bacterium]
MRGWFIIDLKPCCSLALMLAGTLATATLCSADLPHLRDGERYPVGMFRVIGVPDDPEKYDFNQPDLQKQLDEICNGHTGGFEACNILQFYDNPHKSWHPEGLWWEGWPEETCGKILDPIQRLQPQASIILGPMYWMFVSADSTRFTPIADTDAFTNQYLEPGLDMLNDYVRTICEWEHTTGSTGVVAGWYMADEPSLKGRDLAEYYRLVDAIRAAEDFAISQDWIKDHHPMYVTLYPGIITQPPDDRPSQTTEWRDRWINYNGRIYTRNPSAEELAGRRATESGVINAARFPGDGGSYDGRYYFTQWEADNVLIDYYERTDKLGANGWPAWIRHARSDFELRGSRRYGGCDHTCEWKLHAIIPGAYWQDFPTHEDMLEYIRHILDLDYDGIWFFPWTPKRTDTHRFENSAMYRWLAPDTDWAGAVENKIR